VPFVAACADGQSYVNATRREIRSKLLRSQTRGKEFAQPRRIAIPLLTFKLPSSHLPLPPLSLIRTLSIRLLAERLQRTTWLVRGITFAVRSRVASRPLRLKPREMVIGTCPGPNRCRRRSFATSRCGRADADGKRLRRNRQPKTFPLPFPQSAKKARSP